MVSDDELASEASRESGSTMTGFIIHDDGQGAFGPLTDLRPAFRLRTGAQTTVQRIARRLGRDVIAAWVPVSLSDVHAGSSHHPVNELPEHEHLVSVNGRWCGLESLEVPTAGSVLVNADDEVVIAHLPRGDMLRWLEQRELPGDVVRQSVDAFLYRYPWDVLDRLDATLQDDLAATPLPRMTDDRITVHGEHPVHMHPDATMLPGVVADTSGGPVVVDEGAVVRCNAVLVGPCYIGPGTIITDGALIKARCSFGPDCRVGGEVGGTIFQSSSNKSHDGHLGDSIVGCWVNLGAGTTNSNLLNTYSEVIMRLHPDGQSMKTGRIFMGSVIGDHVRTAIGTRLMTGTVLGTGTMVATTAPPPTSVAAFRWLTDKGSRSYRFTKFMHVARTVQARRSCESGPAETALLERLAAAAEEG